MIGSRLQQPLRMVLSALPLGEALAGSGLSLLVLECRHELRVAASTAAELVELASRIACPHCAPTVST